MGSVPAPQEGLVIPVAFCISGRLQAMLRCYAEQHLPHIYQSQFHTNSAQVRELLLIRKILIEYVSSFASQRQFRVCMVH